MRSFRIKSLKPAGVMVLTVTLLAFFPVCDRNNPFDAKSGNYISGQRPLVSFVQDTLTAFLYDTISVRIAWSDTTTGGKKGAIKKFYFSWQGDSVFNDSADATESDTFVIKKAFPPGVFSARVKALDDEGGYSDADSVTLVILESRPRIIGMVSPKTVERSARFTMTVSATDSGGIIRSYLWAINGSDFLDTTAQGSFATSFYALGEKIICVKAMDNKGIVSPADTMRVVIFEKQDTTPPSVVFLSPQDNDSVGKQTIIAYIQAKDENGVATVWVNNTSFQQAQDVWKGPITLVPGKNTIAATATDAKGNSATARVIVFYNETVLDKTPPVIIFKVPAHRQDTILTPSCGVQLLAIDESGVVAVTLGSSLMVFSPADSSFSSTVQLSEGKNTFAIQSVDSKGNIGYDTLTIFHPVAAVDSMPPVITISQPQSLARIADTSVTVSGTATDASGIFSIRVNGMDAARNYPAFSAKTRIRHGYDTLRVTATDSSKNRNTAIASVIVIQNFPPVFSAVSGRLDTNLTLAVPYATTLSASDADNDSLKFEILSSSVHGTAQPSLTASGSQASFAFAPAALGTDTFTVVVRDAWGGADTLAWRVFVSAPGDSVPIFTTDKNTIPDSVIALGAYTATVTARDPRSKPLTYSLVKPPSPQAATVDGTGKIAWTPQEGDTGKFHIVVSASNGKQQDTIGWIMTVVPYDWPPVLTNPGNKVIDKLKPLKFTLSATDKNNDPLDYSFGPTFPLGARLDSTVFSWTPAYYDAGPHQVIFIVKERNRAVPLSDTQSIVITVNNVNVAPVIANPGAKSPVVNQQLSFPLVATDLDAGQVLTYSMTGAPAGAALSGNLFTWTPTYAQVGTYQVSFFVKDNGTPVLWDTAVVALTVVKTNVAPVCVNPGPRATNENQNLAFDLSASDVNGDSITYSMSNAPAGATLTKAHFSWTPTFTQSGPYLVKFIASDNGVPPMSDTVTITITVNNINLKPTLANPGNQPVNENQLLQFTLSATDPNGDNIVYYMLSGPAGSTFSGNQFSWTPGYGTAGPYSAKFYALDNGIPPMSDTQTIPITVSATTPAAPTALTAAVTSPTQVTASWPSSAGATGYVVYYAAGTTVTKSAPTKLTATASPAVVNGLTTGTQYAFAVSAQNGALESGLSQIQTATPKSLVVATVAASGVTTASGTLNGNLTNLGNAATVNVYFQWGTVSGTYANQTTAQARTTAGTFLANLTGLAPNTTYYFRAFVDGGAIGTAAGSEMSFSTVATYYIAATAGANGRISPSGSTPVNAGATQIFTITPDAYYHINDVLVDGISKGAIALDTFTNITANHTISASFALSAAPVLSGAVSGDASVTVSFGAVPGATSYNLYYRAGGNVNKGNATKITGVTSPHTVSGLTNDTQYAFAVTAVSGGVESDLSNRLVATPLPPVPAAPVISSATAGNSAVTVSWNAVPGATSYVLYYKNGSTVDKTTTTKVTAAVSPQAVSGLTNGTEYAFAVSAVNIAGESVLSTVQTATPQVPAAGAPTISAITAGDTKVTVTWGTVTGATSYNLYWAIGATVDKSGTKITGATSPRDVTGLANGTGYAFAVSAVNAGGESGLSTVQTATPQVPAPGAPTISTATAGDTKVTVTWGTVTGATSYNLYWAIGATVDKSGTKITGATSPRDVTGLANGTGYAFAVSAVNAGGESGLSTVQTATPQVPAPGAPTISTATAGDTKVTVTWGTVTGTTSYNLYWAIGATVDKSGTKITGATSPRDVTGLANGTGYAFAVSAVNAGGESGLSTVQTATPQVPAPGAPTISTATAGDTKVTVTWGTVTGATSYNLYWAIGATVDKSGTKITGATSPRDVTGLANGTGYAFAVSAVNAGGESGLSTVQTATPQVPAPGAPTISTATAGDTKVTVTWGTVTGATSYNLYWAIGATVDKSGTKITGVASPSDVTGLANGTGYAFAVSAVNAGGESGLSTVQTATPQVPAPGAPTISTATAGDTKVTVTWGTVTEATSYNLYWAIGATVDKSGTKITGVASPSDVTGLANGTGYAFAVSAVNAGGESGLSTVQTATPQVPAPGAPTIGAATAGDTKVTVTWGTVTGATSYNLYWAVGATVDKNGTKIEGVASPSDVTGLANGTGYAFAVSAVNAGGESDLSDVLPATPSP